ncbi:MULTISPECIES: hypothetical protein [unclassified Sporosarcina]|uniref:hypothetical protein n=1 Tax=unclassified Sporosarcina TaxID=2647733 RepID=UPI00203B9350|nr:MULTISPECIES: hypothetical protein [unclassified Sporosarcina]GKV65497.1 hypothetical protein NCCP2331_16500 [Sporosarcina sp. NCCP-2331]GLB55622.1 hypothetical protein NCCP2378_14090 [Sporosarcina sp. NCCP-2378]
MQDVSCDNCQKEFTIKPKTKNHGISIKETYFICPHCKEKYIAFVTDPECRKLQKQIREFRETKNIPAQQFAANEITDEEYIQAIDDIEKQINRLTQQLEPKMNQLKEQYS